MAVAVQIQFTQGVTVGTPGQALFGAAGTSVQVANALASTFTNRTFTVVSVPYDSAVPIGVAQTGLTPTWAFTPDVDGCFIVLVTDIDGSGGLAQDVRAFGIKTPKGYLVPSFTGDANSLNFGGQLTGWDLYMEQWLDALESLLEGGVPLNVVNVTAAGTIAAAPGGLYFVDLAACGGNVVITTAGTIGVKQKFYVKLIDPSGGGAGGHTVTIQPIVAGQHIESVGAPGELDGSSVSYVLGVVGQEVELTSNDGTNLWY